MNEESRLEDDIVIQVASKELERAYVLEPTSMITDLGQRGSTK